VQRVKYLDIMRGFSILLVLLGHSVPISHQIPPIWTPFFDASLGVRIFFVLSGFIITSLLIHEKESRGFIDWKAFLIKRFSKLLPTLIFLLFLVTVLPNHWVGNCSTRDALVAVFFFSELFGIGCWQLAHTWSLSVEEMFYLSWVPCFMKFSEEKLMKTLIGICCVAPVARGYTHLTSSHPEYFPTGLIFRIPFISHLDLIAFGSIGAIGVYRSWFPITPSLFLSKKGLASITSLVFLIFLSALPFSQIPYLKFFDYLSIPFRSTIQGALLVALICTLISNPNSSKGVFGKSMAYLGSISYSLYLFQQLIIPDRFAEGAALRWSFLSAFFFFFLAIGLGALNYHLFEMPIQKLLRNKCKVFSSRLNFSTVRSR